MADQHERLKKLDNNKLIDAVKNYRQYGYDDALRDAAIAILEERGVSKEELKMMGGFENKTYNHADHLFKSFLRKSRIAFVLYLALFATRTLLLLLPDDALWFAPVALIVTIVAFPLYFIFLISSFINQNQFYKVVGENYGAEGGVLYLFLGMPLYMFMYFYFRNQMRAKMKGIS